MEGNERATHGLELLELFIGNNICCPFLLVVNQWRFMVKGPRYWGTICCVDQQHLQRLGYSQPSHWASGHRDPPPSHSRKDFICRWPKSNLALPGGGTEAEREDAPWWEGRLQTPPATPEQAGATPHTCGRLQICLFRGHLAEPNMLRYLFTSSPAYLGSWGC